MTTTYEDTPGLGPDSEETPSNEHEAVAPRARRFAPRRSRSAALSSSESSEVALPEPPASRSDSSPALVTVEDEPRVQLLDAAPDGQPEQSLSPVEPSSVRPARPRRARSSRATTPAAPAIADTSTAEASLVTSEVAGSGEVSEPAHTAPAGAVQPRAQTRSRRRPTGRTKVAAPEVATAESIPDLGEAVAAQDLLTAPPAATTGAEEMPLLSDATAALDAVPTEGAASTVEVGAEAVREPEAIAEVSPEAIPAAAEATAPPPVRARRFRPRTGRSRPSIELTPTPLVTTLPETVQAADVVNPTEEPFQVASAEPAGVWVTEQTNDLEELPVAASGGSTIGSLESWLPGEDLLPAEPGGDLDGTEALARALLEMFPPEGIAPPIEESAAAVEVELESGLTAAAAKLLADAYEESEGIDGDGDTNESDAARRRSRRGRRGGRGRRRGTLSSVQAIGTELDGETVPEPNGTSTPLAAVLPAASDPAVQIFVPESPVRPTTPWRERPARRQFGRTYTRETPHVSMPPPKPSNGARFAPIPQAAPPVASVPQIERAVPSGSSFTMPDLRIDEPLAPGETRSERLLEVQTRLMQAMLEQQARQIDVLTASVNGLYQAIQGLGTAGGTRTFQPRTGIFVDAPNVCYAAEGARVNLDFGRMLKYLTRDRQLVHALSYSPIIDDVREGIRYETQRFIAPFLRAGYKLITKPLKRFSDGSAKGNFDIELALDILTMSERLDVVVLVSGDSDFESVIEHIQSRGVRVEVVAFASNVSTELVNIADVFIDINQHLEHMRAL